MRTLILGTPDALLEHDTPAKPLGINHLDKVAPFHRSRNSVADAVLLELHSSAIGIADLSADPHAFVTSNSEDFSGPQGDKRQPHPDLVGLFAPSGSSYGLGVDGLNKILLDHFGEELEELFAESDFREEPRRLDEILEAEQEFLDRVWYHRSLQHEISVKQEKGPKGVAALLRIAGPARRRVEAKYSDPGKLGPYTDFELG